MGEQKLWPSIAEEPGEGRMPLLLGFVLPLSPSLLYISDTV